MENIRAAQAPMKAGNEPNCYHCGTELTMRPIHTDAHAFCCEGCVMVYGILKEKNLCRYYDINQTPAAKSIKPVFKEKFAFLDHPEIREKLIRFSDADISLVHFILPAIHCSSCIWLLEHLYRLHPGIARSVVHFQAREIQIWFKEKDITLRQLADTLASVGYEPAIEETGFQKNAEKKEDRSLYYRLGIAGFCFGNIMLLSFPEYFSLSESRDESMKNIFNGLNFMLALPALLYSAAPYFTSAWKSLRRGAINLDVPLALGIAVMFLRSTRDIALGIGPGFMDTLTGLVFFLLIGKWFQRRVYKRLSFDRDYKAYFPLAVNRIDEQGNTEILPIARLEIGQRLEIRNQELIPADALLLKGKAQIDYSFVTGESQPVQVQDGELLYAGGRQTGGKIEIQIIKPVSESYLTQLWNHSAFHKNKEEAFATFSNRVSHIFTQVIVGIAIIAAAYWLWQGKADIALDAFTAVLIIACPCALALSSPFALGNALRILEKNKFYVKNIATIEALAACDTMVLDKTGTLTPAGSERVEWQGITLRDETRLFATLFAQSIHPLSRRATTWLGGADPNAEVLEFCEVPGKGLEARVQGLWLKAGSFTFVTGRKPTQSEAGDGATRIWLMLEGEVLGSLRLQQEYRPGLKSVINSLGLNMQLAVLSGDGNQEVQTLRNYFTADQPLLFRQTPEDKLQYVQALQAQGKKVIMTGDGLNDAGALRQSDAGIAITEDSAGFTPSSDAILEGSSFHLLPQMMAFTRRAVRVIHLSFGISLLYNLTGIFFAVQGVLSPLFAAILMPLSSVTVVVFTTLMTTWMGRKEKLI